MADINKYEITISSKDTSDPEKASQIKRSLKDPIGAYKNQEQIRKEISSMVSETGTGKGKVDDAFVYEAFRELNSIAKNVVTTSVTSGQQSGTSKTKTSQDVGAKEIKESAGELKNSAKELKDAAKELKQEIKKGQKEGKGKRSIASTTKEEDASRRAGTPPSKLKTPKPYTTQADLENFDYTEHRKEKQARREEARRRVEEGRKAKEQPPTTAGGVTPSPKGTITIKEWKRREAEREARRRQINTEERAEKQAKWDAEEKDRKSGGGKPKEQIKKKARKPKKPEDINIDMLLDKMFAEIDEVVKTDKGGKRSKKTNEKITKVLQKFAVMSSAFREASVGVPEAYKDEIIQAKGNLDKGSKLLKNVIGHKITSPETGATTTVPRFSSEMAERTKRLDVEKTSAKNKRLRRDQDLLKQGAPFSELSKESYDYYKKSVGKRGIGNFAKSMYTAEQFKAEDMGARFNMFSDIGQKLQVRPSIPKVEKHDREADKVKKEFRKQAFKHWDTIFADEDDVVEPKSKAQRKQEARKRGRESKIYQKELDTQKDYNTRMPEYFEYDTTPPVRKGIDALSFRKSWEAESARQTRSAGGTVIDYSDKEILETEKQRREYQNLRRAKARKERLVVARSQPKPSQKLQEERKKDAKARWRESRQAETFEVLPWEGERDLSVPPILGEKPKKPKASAKVQAKRKADARKRYQAEKARLEIEASAAITVPEESDEEFDRRMDELQRQRNERNKKEAEEEAKKNKKKKKKQIKKKVETFADYHPEEGELYFDVPPPEKPPEKPPKKKKKIPSRRATGEDKSLIESSDALMSQIKNDFMKFKKGLADVIRTRLKAEHAGGFKVVEGKGGAFTRRGGTEVLKIANMKDLTGALLKLTNSVEKTAALEKEGPAAMIKEASSRVMADMLGGMGKSVDVQQKVALRKTADYINKYGYEGENKEIQKLVREQTVKEKEVPLAERKGIRVNQLASAMGKEFDIAAVMAETIGREEINRTIGGAIKEVVVSRPVAGPQGLPAIQLPSGRQRALAPEYEFTPGILAAGEYAKKLIETGGESLPDKAITDRIQTALSTKRVDEKTGRETTKVANIKQMMVKDDRAGIASHASDIMEVMKTDKKGRLELINAYRTVLGAKGEKQTGAIPKGKKEQLIYLEKLATDAKRLSLGFDDVIVAMGKLSKSNIFERLLGSLTAEGLGGKTSPVRTTMRDIGKSEEAIDQFNKRIREPFTDQEIIDEHKPRQSYYLSKASKLISPRLTKGGPEDFIGSAEKKAALKALNRETEQYLSLTKGIAGYPEKLTSQGVAEGPSQEVKPDPRDPSKVITNAFTEDIRQLMPLGQWSNFGRNIASTYQGIGGGRTVGGMMAGGLETPLLGSKRSRELEESGMWGGKKGYGLNLQTVMADSAGTFEDQIEIAGKAVNRFSEYIKPKIKDVKDVESANVIAKDIVKSMAPGIGEQLGMKGAEKTGDDKPLVSEISKILTSKTGASLDQRAVSIIERIFTALGTKMTTHAMSKGTVTFKKGEEGELGYTKRPTFTHELMAKMLEEKKGGGKRKDTRIDKMLGDLGEVGTVPFIDFMQRDLPKEVQKRFKKIKKDVLAALEIKDLNLSNADLIKKINSMAKDMFGDDVMTKTIPNEVRMSLSGAVKRLSLNEPLEAVFNNIAGNVKTIAPTTADVSPGGEVSRVLKAMGYGFGPETGKEGRTLPMYSQMEGMGDLTQAIAGQKFWQYTRNPSQEAEWGKEDIWSGRKGQKMNIAAMGAITSMFGEKSAVTREAMAAYMPETHKSLEKIMALKSLGDEPQKSIPKEAYLATQGLKELPGVIEKYGDLRSTILDPKYSAGGYAKVPEFDEKGKEVGVRPVYVPSRETLSTYAEKGEGLGANTLATRYSSLLSNVEKYRKLEKQQFVETDKPDIDVLRKNVGKEIGTSVKGFRESLDSTIFDKKKGGLGKDDTKGLLEFLRKLYAVLDKMSGAERAEKVPGLDKTTIASSIKSLEGDVGRAGGTLTKKGGGLYRAKDLLMQLKDIVIEPKVDTKNINRARKDLELLKKGGSFADLSEESYLYYKKEAIGRKGKTSFNEETFEAETSGARQRIVAGLKNYVKTLSYGEKNIGVLSASPGAVMEGARQFGVTTDPKQQALEESRKNIENDKRKLGEELVKGIVGKEKGVDILQTRKIPAIRGQMHAALIDKVDDFKEAVDIINSLGREGVLKDTGISERVGGQVAKHKEQLKKEVGEGAIALREGEVGMHAGKIEKLVGEYGEGKTALDAVREGKDITTMTTRFPYTGLSSTQFAKVRETTHPKSRDVISVGGGTPIGVDMPALEKDIKKLRDVRSTLREKRGGLAEAKTGTAEERNLDIERKKLTTHITKLTKAIDLLETKFHGYAQGADFDGDHINVHAAKTKEAAKEMERVASDYKGGVFGQTQDPRAFLNKMMGYEALGLKSSMADLAGTYVGRADIRGAKLLQTPDVTKEMKGMGMSDVIAGLAERGVTQKKIDETVRKKGLEGPRATETVARGMLHDKIRGQQLEKIYVKAGLGESTESINKLARFLEASVGFGDKQIGKKEYEGWKEESVALGAVYDKKGALQQVAKPGREMQTMMNYMLNAVIQSGMDAKHGSKAMFEDVSQGLASGDLFGKMETEEMEAGKVKKKGRFAGILKANEIIKQTIRDRLDALSSVDFAAEAKRHDVAGKGRVAITDELVKKFSFEGFVGDMSEDIQNQIGDTITKRHMEKGVAEPEARKRAARELTKKRATGKLNVSSYFKDMQPAYSLRSSSASIDSLAKQANKGTTKLDQAMSRVLKIIKASGEGVTFSDTLMQGSFRSLFEMFDTTEKFANKLDKAFTKGKTLKQKEKITSGLERKLGVPKMSAKEQEMLRTEVAERIKTEEPAMSKEDAAERQRQYVLSHRQEAIKRHVAAAKYKRGLLTRVSPEIGASYAGYTEAKKEIPPKPPKPPKPPTLPISPEELPPKGERYKHLLKKEQLWQERTQKARDRWRISQGKPIEMYESDARSTLVGSTPEYRAEKLKQERIQKAKDRWRISQGKHLTRRRVFDSVQDDMPDMGYGAYDKLSFATTKIQSAKETGRKAPKGEIWMPRGDDPSKVEQIPRGKTADVDYSMFGKGSVKGFVNILKKYREALKLLSEGAENLTEKQTKKAQEALQFIEAHKSDLTSIPLGAKGHKASRDVLGLYEKIKGVKQTPPTTLPTGKTSGAYGSSIEALMSMTAKAEATTGYSAEGMPAGIVDALEGIRSGRIRPAAGADEIKKLMDEGVVPKEKGRSIWKQYHIEKVKSQIIRAQKAEEVGDYEEREKAVLSAKERAVGTYGSSLTPFLTRERGGTGRVTGHIDEVAAAKLGIQRPDIKKKDIQDEVARTSGTAAEAMKPLLFGSGRMEERLKATWEILRKFSPELAKAGKHAEAFDFENAKADIAIIREGLSKLKFSGKQMSADEFADIEHALKKTKQMQTALQETPAAALPTMALKGLESKETAEAAWENLQAKTIADMEEEFGVSVAAGTKRKISMQVPTAEGLMEKRTMTLVAQGDQLEGMAGKKFAGVKRIDEKSQIEQAYTPSRRSARLFDQFQKSTDKMGPRIQELYLGIKRFSAETGKVNFDEALEDLRDLQILIQSTLQQPGLTEEKKIDLKHLKKKVGAAYRTLAETAPEEMPGVIMKGMETQKSAEAALKQQVATRKEQMMEMEDLEVGMATTIAATIPTAKGPRKEKVKLVAVGDEEGRVTGIKEERYKPKKEFIDELLKGKTSRAASLFKSLTEGTGDVNKRISEMILGIKKFDISMVKAGKHADAINFNTAESDLIEMIALFDQLIKGATTLTDKEREMYTMARTAAKEMHRKIVKTPEAGRAAITMGGYETAASSLAAYEAKIKATEKGLKKLGQTAVVTGKVMTESGQEVTRKTRLTARGDKWFGFGGQVSKVRRKEEIPGGAGQTESVIRRVAMWGSASGIIYGIIGGVRQMVETMKVAEVGMTNLKKVMPSVGTDFDKMRESAIGFAQTYGAELKGVLETMRIFAQQGLPQPQVVEMARVSTLAANVTTMDPTKAAEALTSATRQFNLEAEDSIKMLDSWNEVENKFAITAADLADGFKKAGTAARITGIDIHQLNGIITAIGESTRQTGKEVGTSLKFIFSRMATEKAPKALTRVGVETMSGGRLREGSDILDDLAKKWVGLSRSERLATAQAIGGIRHYNTLMVLMENYDRALAASAASLNSVGSAERENKMVMETYEKQLAKTKASFDALAVSASGPILTALKAFTISIRGIIDILSAIPGGGLGAMMMGAYGGATMLGKYFDMSMFGLMGQRGVGGERRERRQFKDMPKAIKEKYSGMGARAMQAGAVSSMMFGVEKTEQRNLIKQVAPQKVAPSVGALGKLKNVAAGIGPAFITARNTSLGFLASLGPFAKIALVLAAVGSAVWAIGKAMSSTFALSSERTKEYTENLETVEATLDKIGGARTLSRRLGITTEKVKVLEELTPKQIATQVKGRSYKSPLLLMKQQQQQVRGYANAVASMTTEGTYGFDKFGNAIISTTDDLGGVVTKLEEIANKSVVDLKLNIVEEQLKDLTSGAEEGFFKRFRDLVRGGGKLVGADVMEGYLTPYEKMNENIDRMTEMRREAAKEGRTITPPSMGLKKEDPGLYKKRKEEYKEFTKLNVERMSGTKEYDEKFIESKREFMSIRRPGLAPELAGIAATSEAGTQLAELEAARSPFYKRRGVEAPEIQAGYFHKLLGSLAIRPTAALTRETAMEQGILPREATAEALEGLRAGDIMLAKKEARFKGEGGEFGIVGGQIQLLKGVGEAGEDMVAYVKKSATASGEILEPIIQSKKEFFDMLGGVQKVAENISMVVDSAGMLSETAMKLRAISTMPTGAEAGMFKPTKEKKLDLGKQYKFQVDTGMLIQNNAFKNLSKNTEGFVNSYVQKQEGLRKQQKAALDIYGKRGSIDDSGANSAKALALNLAGVTNTAIQLIRATTEMDKSFARLALRFKEQQAVQDMRRKVKLKTSGLLVGMPEVKTPQIDTRKFSELSPHEKLRAASPEYETNLLAYDEQLNKYNAALVKAETSAKTLANIEYVKEEAAGRGIDQKEIDALVAGTAITGSKETGPMLGELSTQTTILRDILDKMSAANTISSGAMPLGIKLAGMRAESVYEGAELRKQTMRAGESDIAGYMANNNLGAVADYRKEFEKASESYPATRKMITDALLSSGAVDSGALKAMLLGAGVSEERYTQAKEKGELGKLVYKEYEPLMKYAEEYGKKQKEAAKEGGKEPKKPELILDYMDRMKEEAKKVIKEREEYAGTAHKENLTDVENQGEVLTTLAQRLAKAQIATKTFNIVMGDLGKAVEGLTVSFLKLEKQSMVNKALIDTRAQYMSTRGGPMKRKGPAVDVDVGTTASQYQPHQILYNKSPQYRAATTDYLKNMEDVKTARSKLEQLSKIEAQKKFLEKQPGVKKEEVDRFLTSAMRTGSVELAPVVTELSQIRENTARTADNVLNIGKETKEDVDDSKKQQQSAEVMMEKQRLQAQAENKTAERRAGAGADYLRKEQIKVQTAKDVAAGRGKSQDQVNREESEYMATLGYVPPEVKSRNEQLRAVYEKEKEARAEFELAKQKELKPLQESSSAMGSLISSIQTGVAGIKGGRNIRPLQRDLEKWSEGKSEEQVAEAQGQFGLAQSLYSQNLSLRSQQIDTDVAPRELYDIMKRASKGEDVTGELQDIEKRLAEAKEEKDAEIRKVQAKEYAMAMSNSAGTKQANTSLDAIDKNTRTMQGAYTEGSNSIVDAIKFGTEGSNSVIDAIKSGTSEIVSVLESIITKCCEGKDKTAEAKEAKQPKQTTAEAKEAKQPKKTMAEAVGPGEDKSKKTLQVAKDAGAVVYEGKKVPTAETKATHVYTGAYGGEITKTPVRKHQWGVPVGGDVRESVTSEYGMKEDVPFYGMTAGEPTIAEKVERTSLTEVPVKDEGIYKPTVGEEVSLADKVLTSLMETPKPDYTIEQEQGTGRIIKVPVKDKGVYRPLDREEVSKVLTSLTEAPKSDYTAEQEQGTGRITKVPVKDEGIYKPTVGEEVSLADKVLTSLMETPKPDYTIEQEQGTGRIIKVPVKDKGVYRPLDREEVSKVLTSLTEAPKSDYTAEQEQGTGRITKVPVKDEGIYKPTVGEEVSLADKVLTSLMETPKPDYTIEQEQGTGRITKVPVKDEGIYKPTVGEEVSSADKVLTSPEAKPEYVYVGAGTGETIKVPAKKHMFGVPVGDVRETVTSEYGMEEGVPFYGMTAGETTSDGFTERTTAGTAFGATSYGRGGYSDYLMASDEKKSQMAAAMPFEDKAKPFVETDFGYDEKLKAGLKPAKTKEEIKKEETVKDTARGGLTMTFPEKGESMGDFVERTKSPEQRREDAARRDIELNYGKDKPVPVATQEEIAKAEASSKARSEQPEKSFFDILDETTAKQEQAKAKYEEEREHPFGGAGLTVTLPEEGESVKEFAERTKSPEQRREDAARRDIELNYGKDKPVPVATQEEIAKAEASSKARSEQPEKSFFDILDETAKKQEMTKSATRGALSPEQKREEMVKSAAKGGITMTFPEKGESMEDFSTRVEEQSREDRTKEAAFQGLTIIPEDLNDPNRAFNDTTKLPELDEEEIKRRRAARALRPDYSDVVKNPPQFKYIEDYNTSGMPAIERSYARDQKEIAQEREFYEKYPEKAQKATGLEKEDEKSKNLKKETLNKDTKQSKDSRDESKDLNNEISDLKDEMEGLKTAISDVTDVFKDLSDSVDNITSLGDASKDSASSIENLGGSADSASSSLDILSSQAANTDTTSTETGPTMEAQLEEYDFISEEDAINLVDFTKGELLEKIDSIDSISEEDAINLVDFTKGELLEKITEIDNVEKVNTLSEKTDAIGDDVASIKEEVLAIPGGVNEEDFNSFKDKASEYFNEIDKIKTIEVAISKLTSDVETLTSEISAAVKNTDTKDYESVSSEDFEAFKSEVSSYMETIEELKILTDNLTNTSSSNTTSILDLETAFGLVEKKLRNHDSQFTKIEENLDTLDHKFTNWIKDLEDDVGTAIDLARSAYSMATQG